jgi:acyl-CoA synthetase (NDP forming)
MDRGVVEVLQGARAEGRDTLLEGEAFALIRPLGLRVPAQVLVRGADEARGANLDAFPGDRVVVKASSPQIPHKTDVGGVALVPREPAAVAAAIETMQRRLRGQAVAGYSINEFVPHDEAFGGQLLLGVRWTEEFGPVVAFGPGGGQTELLAELLAPGRGVAVLAPGLLSDDRIGPQLHARAVTQAATGVARGGPVRASLEELTHLVAQVLRFAAEFEALGLAELEINPIALTPSGPVALDVLARLRPEGPGPQHPPRPVHKLQHLLQPRSVAVVGVSEGINPGRIILKNLLREGFPPERIAVVKPGTDAVDGVRCYPDIAALPGPVDLFILSIAAAQTPSAVEEIVAAKKAESLIVIPGGLGERRGTEALEQRLRAALVGSRRTAGGGPVLNGGNCLGVRSVPGRYDTMFIPEYKLPWPGGDASGVALISQSGAFAVARSSKLARLNPRYVVSVGNQTDLTVADYLVYLMDDPELEVFACYVEGFRPGDGRRWLDAAAEIVAGGRTVLLYRGGRTAAGAAASASHTAAIAGDYTVIRELARSIGVVVADTLADFEDLVRLFWHLRGTQVGGWGLGAVSNAGFECVAIADALGRFRLAPFGDATRRRLEDLLVRCRLDQVIEARNPLDVTPTMDDASAAEAVRAILDEPGVDVGVVGCVPLTGALNTLAPGPTHGENLEDPRSVVSQLVQIRRESPKAWVAVVDGGPQYDPMADRLDAHGVPTFRTADRGLRLFERYVASRLGLNG